MDKELNYYLAKKYSRIFLQKTTQSEFSWSFECNSGWFNLINSSCLEIQSYIDHNNKQYEDNLLYQSYIDNNELDKLPEWKRKRYDQGEPLEIGNYCPQVVAKQIKEKFGTLRFYYEGGDSFCRGVISHAENMSCTICEDCGDEGKYMSKKGFVRVLCQKHAKELGFIEQKISNDEDLQVLMQNGYQKMKVIQAISATEVIAENEENLKVHAFKHSHNKIDYWSGSILKD